MAIYTYDDNFVIDSLDALEIDRYENQALEEVEKIGVVDEHYKKRLTINRVYMLACRSQLENDGMEARYKMYEKEYDRAMKEAISYKDEADGIKNTKSFSSVEVVRG